MLTMKFQTSGHMNRVQFLWDLVNMEENVNYVSVMEKQKFCIAAEIQVVLSVIAFQVNSLRNL